MKQEIAKWENSIQESDDSSSHVVKPKKNQKTIGELFEGYDGPKLEEVDFGEPEGKEAW